MNEMLTAKIGQEFKSPIFEIGTLKWIIEAYKTTEDKTSFFKKSFNLLAGNYELKKQIIDGKSEEEIKLSWKSDLDKFKKIRSKYLFYD